MRPRVFPAEDEGALGLRHRFCALQVYVWHPAEKQVAKTIGATEFKATCLRVIKQLGRDGEPVTITNGGRPVPVLSPAPAPGKRSSLIGAMRGSVLRYDDPFAPAADPSHWNAAR